MTKTIAEDGVVCSKPSRGDVAALAEMASILDRLPETYYRRRAGCDGAMVYLSKAVEALTGYTAEELFTGASRSFSSLVHPDDQQGLAEEIERALRSRRPFVFHYRLMHRSGGVRYVCERGAVAENSQDELLIEGSISDETERLWAKKTIHEHARELEGRAERQSELVGFLRGVNAACEDLLFARQDRQVYTIATEALTGRGQAGFAALYLVRETNDEVSTACCSTATTTLEEAARSGKGSSASGAPERAPDLESSLVGEAVMTGHAVMGPASGTGSESWRKQISARHCAAVPLRFESSSVGAVLVLRATPYRPEELQALELLARHIVAAVVSTRRAEQLQFEARRQAELVMRLKEANRDLDASRVMAEQANRLKSEFLSQMSHEVRTPLSGILGLSELLGESSLDEEQRDSVASIQTCAESLLVLLNEVLDLSKIEAGRIDLDPQPLLVDQLIDTVLETLSVKAGQKRLALEAVLAEGVPREIFADGGRLRQILINLLGNAIKFTAKGSVILRVQPAPGPAGETELVFRVEDTGTGIEKTDQRKIFEPFIQSGDASSRAAGTGLGLAISRQLVQLMGGEIRVESEFGSGSVFSVQLPLRRTRPAELEGLRARSQKPDHGIVMLTKDRLLAESAAAWMRRLDIAMELAEDPHEIQEALTRLKRREMTPCALLVDRADRSSLSESELPIIVIDEPGSRGKSEDGSGGKKASGRVRRPLRQRALERSLSGVLERNSAPRPKAAETRRVRGARVLLVEDDPVSQKLVRKILEGAGVKVCVARNGRRGVESFLRGSFDLVLMDLHMPVMNGLAAAKGMRASECSRQVDHKTPILALSADVMPGDREAFADAGMDGQLSKPIRADQLLAAVERWRR